MASIPVHGCLPRVARVAGGEGLGRLSRTPAAFHSSKPNSQDSTWGRNKRGKSRGNVEAHPSQLDENHDVIAQSHPAVGTPGRAPKPREGTRGRDNGPGGTAGGLHLWQSPEEEGQGENMEGSRWEASGRRRGRAKTRRREGTAPRGGGSRRGPPRRGAGADGRAHAARHGRPELSGRKMPRGAGQPRLRHLPARCSTGPRKAAGDPDTASRGRGSPLPLWRESEPAQASCGQEAGSPAVTSGLAVTPLPPSPPHPVGSSNVGPNPWDQRPQTAATVSGTSPSERGRRRGEGGPTGNSSRRPRAWPRLPAGAARSSLGRPTRSGAWTNQ